MLSLFFLHVVVSFCSVHVLVVVIVVILLVVIVAVVVVVLVVCLHFGWWLCCVVSGRRSNVSTNGGRYQIKQGVGSAKPLPKKTKENKLK